MNYKQKFMINKWENFGKNNNIHENNIEDYYNWDKPFNQINDEHNNIEDNDSKIIEISFYSSEDENNGNQKKTTNKTKRNIYNSIEPNLYHDKHRYYTNRISTNK